MSHTRTNTCESSGKSRTARSVIVLLALIWIALVSCETRIDKSDAPVRSEDRIAETKAPESSKTSHGPSGIAPEALEPQHGGLVRSVDVYVVEIAGDPPRVWVYDRHGQPLPPKGIAGQIVTYTADQRHPRGLEIDGDHFATTGQASLPESGLAFVELTVEERPIDVMFTLPIGRSGPSDEVTSN